MPVCLTCCAAVAAAWFTVCFTLLPALLNGCRLLVAARESRDPNQLVKPLKRAKRAVDVDTGLLGRGDALKNELDEEKQLRSKYDKLQRTSNVDWLVKVGNLVAEQCEKIEFLKFIPSRRP